ncbi:hypothetical protein SEVIR_2G341800v4 [Setaria viridis]|uniref:RRM domain-containing protein n=2 Tax=Setaria TaxID=4554 RepID=K3ZRK5_SETIT|nr:serine/arginine repetitive matrix protein 2 [Setaria italica]XP_034580477.1 serine/arginine repetitive matrix protein 2-like [Setaria viridis]RCV13238.1 hypothetical protein SETIT_2G331200v2 [Setaria italica]TKW34986.1 hypothetical protein SEVIR_2G341800v2 [Setaria viridis]TKW34987.1 hypothetical protein SEVIR_2G341800v2 [Setaria viridis]
MEYISPERNLEGTCGDPGPLFGDQDGSLLDHLDYQGGGMPQHESPTLDDGLLVDPADAIPYLSGDSLPFMNDQITCNVMKSASTSPESSLKQVQEPLKAGSDVQNDASEQNVHNSNSKEQATSVDCDVHQNTEVIGAVLPPELPESSGNDASNFQPEIMYSDAYHGDSLLTENSNKDCQLNNSSADDDELPNSPALQMENEDMEKLQETSHNEKSGSEDDQMNGRKSSPIDGKDKENFNTSVEPPSWEQTEQENPGTRNGSSTPDNRFDSPPDRFARLERDTPSPDGRVSPDRFARLERDTPSPDGRVSPPVGSPHTHHSEKMESQRHAKDVGHSESPPARRRSGSSEKHDPSRKRPSSREMSPHAQNHSPVERKRRRESRHGDGSPRRRSASPRRRSTPPRRRSISPRRSSHKRRESPRRGDSPRRRHSPRRRESPRKRESPRRRDSPKRRRDSPRRRDRSRSRSPSRRHDRHRREHDRSRSRSPHRRDHHRRSPRRHSPRRRSPSSSHRHNSPRRHHWSPPANRKTGLGKPGKNLFIAGFSYATTERDLEKKFCKFGRVTSARVVRDKRTGDSRGFGFLSLEKDEDADAAIRACDETEWNGRIILVEKSKAPAW